MWPLNFFFFVKLLSPPVLVLMRLESIRGKTLGPNERSCFTTEMVLTFHRNFFSDSGKIASTQKEAVSPPDSQAQLKHKLLPEMCYFIPA